MCNQKTLTRTSQTLPTLPAEGSPHAYTHIRCLFHSSSQPGTAVTPSPSRRRRSSFWLGALLVLAAVLGAAWLANSMSDRGLITTPAMDPRMPPMPGMDHETMPGMRGGASPSSP